MVKDVEIAYIVEDTIELYILDTTLRRSLYKGKTSAEIREMLDEMSDFEEARTLRVDETPSHGHFTGWRRAFEQHYAKKLGKANFLVMGEVAAPSSWEATRLGRMMSDPSNPDKRDGSNVPPGLTSQMSWVPGFKVADFQISRVRIRPQAEVCEALV